MNQSAFLDDPKAPSIDLQTAVSLGLALGRIDEAVKDDRSASAFQSWFVRTEAMRIASREGHGTDEFRFAGYLNDTGEETPNQTLNTTKDIALALRIVLRWNLASPGEADLREVWEASDSSNKKIESPETQWRLDQAFAVLAQTIDVLLTDPSPEKTAKAFMTVYRHETFGRRGHRLALLLAPYLVKKGFRLSRATAGVAKHLDAEKLRSADLDQDEVTALFVTATAQGATVAYEALRKMERLHFDLSEMAAPERRTVSMSEAIRFLISNPVANAQLFATQVGMTLKGAHVLLARLEKSGCISRGESSSKNRVFVCHKALNL